MYRLLLRMLALSAIVLGVLCVSTSAAENPRYRITVTHGGTPLGSILLELFPDVAPQHVRNFDSLVAIKFYDRTAFHRVIPGFMIQGGDPNSRDKPRDTWGYGEPGQRQIPAEFNNKKHVRGILSAARASDPNSATSQFFICVATASHLDGKYSIYGQVVEGMDVVDAIVNAQRDSRDNPIEKVEMSIVKVASTDVPLSLPTPLFAIETAPQPASDHVVLRYGLLRSGVVSVGVYNQLGQSVVAPLSVVQTVGAQQVSLDVSALPNGVYYLRLAVDGIHTIRPVVVAR